MNIKFTYLFSIYFICYFLGAFTIVSAQIGKKIIAPLRGCHQRELRHKAIQRICIAAIIDCRFLTYLVAIPRHRVSFKI